MSAFLPAARVKRPKERSGYHSAANHVKSEDLAVQAVAGGQADVGVGTPYAAMQRLKVPLRTLVRRIAQYQIARPRKNP